MGIRMRKFSVRVNVGVRLSGFRRGCDLFCMGIFMITKHIYVLHQCSPMYTRTLGRIWEGLAGAGRGFGRAFLGGFGVFLVNDCMFVYVLMSKTIKYALTADERVYFGVR